MHSPHFKTLLITWTLIIPQTVGTFSMKCLNINLYPFILVWEDKIYQVQILTMREIFYWNLIVSIVQNSNIGWLKTTGQQQHNKSPVILKSHKPLQNFHKHSPVKRLPFKTPINTSIIMCACNIWVSQHWEYLAIQNMKKLYVLFYHNSRLFKRSFYVH